MRIYVCLICFFFLANFADAETILAVMEESPGSYLKNNKVAGGLSEVVEATFQKAGVTDYKIEIYPWARAYRMALDQKNILIFLTRTPQREALFNWVGQIVLIENYFLKLKEREDIVIQSLQDAKKFNTGVVRDDFRHKYLASMGFAVGFPGLQIVTNNKINLMKLIGKRIDLFPVSNLEILHLCQQKDFDCSTFQKAYTLEDITTGLYMAYSKTTSDEVVQKTSRAFNQIKAEGILHKIVSPYLDALD